MAKDENRKLTQIIEAAPAGFVFTTTWLEQHGISSKLAWWYVRAGLLERVGGKAYKKAGDQVTWLGAVSALQNQLGLPLHVGGITALQLLDLCEFDFRRDRDEVMLFADLETRTLLNSTLMEPPNRSIMEPFQTHKNRSNGLQV